MRTILLLLAVIPCVASLSEIAMAQSAGTGGTRDFVTSPQMVFPIRLATSREFQLLFSRRIINIPIIPIIRTILIHIHLRLWSD